MIEHQFNPLTIKDKNLLPIVQGGMGVGVSAHRLAGAVAREGGVGTIASVDLRHLHEDLIDASNKTRSQEELDRLNCIALDREIRLAREQAAGKGLVAVNVMKAVGAHGQHVRQACESGADAIVMGAGLPLDLPEMTADYPNVALIPILSDSRGINVVMKRWMRKGCLPDAIVIEHPNHAGGHLGAPRIEDLHDPKFSFERVLAETRALFDELQIADKVPLIVAGGINSFEKVKHYLGCGASGVQLGTAFAVTHESDAHPGFKDVLAKARREDIVEFISAAGLPARAVLTPWLKTYLGRIEKLQANAKADIARCTQGLHCLSTCGLRDGLSKVGQFCIDMKLSAAMRGEVGKGLFFRGSETLPFGEAIRSVRELMDYMLTGERPADLQLA